MVRSGSEGVSSARDCTRMAAPESPMKSRTVWPLWPMSRPHRRLDSASLTCGGHVCGQGGKTCTKKDIVVSNAAGNAGHRRCCDRAKNESIKTMHGHMAAAPIEGLAPALAYSDHKLRRHSRLRQPAARPSRYQPHIRPADGHNPCVCDIQLHSPHPYASSRGAWGERQAGPSLGWRY